MELPMPSLDELLACFDPDLPLERAETIPASWYHDPDLHQAERGRVFGNCWLAVGRADQVSSPGSFFTAEVAGEPIVVVRDGAGVLRGFYNVCRHRAAQVACEPQGQATRFRCRYHGWTYDLTGRLRGTPEFDGVECFAKDDNGLVAVHVAERGPLVWAHLGADPAPLDDWLAPLARRGTFEQLAGFRWYARREYRLECNWKVFVDNYLDGGYHVNTVHPGLAGVLDYSGYHTEIDSHASVQISPMKSKDESVRAVRAGDHAYYWWLFPNLMLNLYDTAADTNVVLPDGVGRCRVIFDFYFRATEGAAAQFAEESIRVGEAIQMEDVGICEEVQRGLASRSFDTGRFSVRREAGGYHFHQLLARRLREPAQAGR
jgi:choline monooxygenase